MKLIRQARQIVNYVFPSRHSAMYYGFLGYSNLGDEALYTAIQSAFVPAVLKTPPMARGKLWTRIKPIRPQSLAILGGGTLIGADLASGANPFFENFASLADQCRNSIAFGTGVGELGSDPVKNQWLQKWKPYLQACKYVGVRGASSVKSLSSIDVQAELLGDPACLLAKPQGFWSPQPKTLGVTVGVTRDPKVLDALRTVIQEKLADGWSITIFDVCVDDKEIVDNFRESLNSKQVKCKQIYHNAAEYLEAVRSMSVFVGIRLHSVILSLCAGVPSIMLAYAPKCYDFMNSVQLEKWTLDINSFDAAAMTLLLEQLSADTSIPATIADKMGTFRDLQLARAASLRAQFFQ